MTAASNPEPHPALSRTQPSAAPLPHPSPNPEASAHPNLHPSQVANKTNDVAGDGTTTATVLTRAIFAEGCKSVAAVRLHR